MKTLIIYDNEGYIISQISGDYRVPVGVPYLEITVPEGKRIVSGIGVDTSTTPHKVIFENIPPSEVEVLRMQVIEQERAIMDLAEFLAGTVI